MKLANIVKKEIPPAVQAVAESNPTPARAALQVFRDGELAAGQRAGHAAAQTLEAARAARLERKRTLDESSQRASAAAAANNRAAFRTASVDVDFDERQVVIAEQAVAEAEQKQRTLAQMFVGLEQRRVDLVIAVLMEEARGHEAELHRLEVECMQRFASLTALLDYFRSEKVVGRPVEELGEIFQRLRDFAIVTDAAREIARASLRELLNNLN